MSGLIFWLAVLLGVYVYAGYPVLVALAARLRPKTAPYPPASPGVTLLIAAYNEEAVMAAKLENSLALHYPQDRLQILVAADGSDDRTVEIVCSFAGRGVELSFVPERSGKMAAINQAMPQARGEIVVFSDANNLYQPDTLDLLVRPFSDPRVGGVSGAKHILSAGDALGSSEGLYWKYESFIKEQESRLDSCTGVTGEILAIRSGLFIQPPPAVINDDFFIAMQIIRQGYRLAYEPRALSLERVSQTVQDEIIRRTRIIAGRYQAIGMAARLLPFNQPLVVWQVVSHKFLRPLVPFAMLLALLANLAAVLWPPVGGAGLLRLAFPYNWVLLGFQALFYALAGVGSFVRRGRLGRVLYLPAFLVNSNLAALLGLLRYLSRRQTVVWQKVKRQENVLI